MKLCTTRRAFLSLSLLAGLGVAGCGGGSTNLPSTSSAPTGRIAFAQFERSSDGTNNNKVGRSDIYLSNADGSGLKRLTPESLGTDNSSPQIAPDGNRVAFVSGDDASADIYVVNSDGTGLRRVTNSAGRERSLNWTRDGRDLIYAASPDDQSPTQIYRVRLDGGNAPQKLFNDNIARFSPLLAPDGRTLAFVTDDENGDFQITLSGADGSRPRRITSGEFPGSIQAFTPDGQRLVYSFLPPNPRASTNIKIINLDGTPASDATLPVESYDALSLAFSPDGKYLVYSGNSFDPSPGASSLGRNSKLYVTRADGMGERKLLNTVDATVVQYSPSWGR